MISYRKLLRGFQIDLKLNQGQIFHWQFCFYNYLICSEFVEQSNYGFLDNFQKIHL